MTLYDMHCHLDFMDDAPKAVAEARGIACYSVTVTPRDYERAACMLHPFESVRVGLGLHPWWIADGSCGAEDISLFEDLAQQTAFIGEVGLDFGKRCEGSQDVQLLAFERVLATCAQGSKVLSIHAVKAVSTLLDLLEQRTATEKNACILHWFSGSSDELQRAIRLGCYFSVGPRMIASKRGRAYVQAMPRDRILLETDAPSAPGESVSLEEIERMLADTLEEIERLRGESIADCIAQTSERLLS